MTATIVVDTSVIVALVEGEPEAGRFEAALRYAEQRLMAAPSVFEAILVLTRLRNQNAERIVRAELLAHDISVAPFDDSLLSTATRAFVTFGKSRHPAALNFGDCMAYALAAEDERALLFKGDDFAKTDVRVATW